MLPPESLPRRCNDEMLSDKKVLITGGTGRALRLLTEALAADNEVWCLARFTDPQARAELEAQGINTFAWSMGDEPLTGLDTNFTHVLNGSHPWGTGTFNGVIQAVTAGIGTLMYHCRNAESFVFISTFAVYDRVPTPFHEVSEDYPLGGFSPFSPTYGPSKISAEGAVRACAAAFGLPATIARLNMSYSTTSTGGLPIQYFERMVAGQPIPIPAEGDPVACSLISVDDITHFSEGLWAIASPSTTIVNLAGDEPTSVVEFMGYLGELAGLSPEYVVGGLTAPQTKVSDNTRRRELLGDCTVPWREGLPKAIEAHIPDAFAGT
jgi:UDP-glucuronate 4-epimerase